MRLLHIHCPNILSNRKCQLPRLGFKGVKIGKNRIDFVNHAVLLTGFFEYLHQMRMVRAVANIGITERADVCLLHARERCVQTPVKMLAAARSEGHAKPETEDTLHLCPNASVQNPAQVFFGVVDKRQNRTEPNDTLFLPKRFCPNGEAKSKRY